MKRTNLALVKTQAAVVTVAVRPSGKDRWGNPVLSQRDIDRLPEGYLSDYNNQRMGQVVGSDREPRPRTLWQRLKGRWGR